MTTSTLAEIIAKIATVITALTPGALSAQRFDRAPRRYPLRLWAPQQGASTATLRKFEINRVGPRQDPGVIDPTAYFVNRDVLVTVAYPVLPALYGRNDLDDLEDIVEADALQIRDALFSPTGLASAAHQETVVVVEDLDRSDDDVWFQPFTLTVKYFSPQTFV